MTSTHDLMESIASDAEPDADATADEAPDGQGERPRLIASSTDPTTVRLGGPAVRLTIAVAAIVVFLATFLITLQVQGGSEGHSLDEARAQATSAVQDAISLLEDTQDDQAARMAWHDLDATLTTARDLVEKSQSTAELSGIEAAVRASTDELAAAHEKSLEQAEGNA